MLRKRVRKLVLNVCVPELLSETKLWLSLKQLQDGEHMYTCGGFILIFGKTNTIM